MYVPKISDFSKNFNIHSFYNSNFSSAYGVYEINYKILLLSVRTQKTRLRKLEAMLNSRLLQGNLKFLLKFKNEIKKQRLRGVIPGKAKKAFKYYRRKTHRAGFERKKPRKEFGSIYVWPCVRYQISFCSDFNARYTKFILLKEKSKRGQI